MNSLILKGSKKSMFYEGLHTVFKDKAKFEYSENIALIFKGEYLQHQIFFLRNEKC
jgi:hypothetical protein